MRGTHGASNEKSSLAHLERNIMSRRGLQKPMLWISLQRRRRRMKLDFQLGSQEIVEEAEEQIVPKRIEEIHDRALQVSQNYKRAELALIEILQELDRNKVYLHYRCTSLMD